MRAQWRRQYQRNPYLRKISNDGLEHRYCSIVNNLWSVDRLGQVKPQGDPEWRRKLRRWLAHVDCEQENRPFNLSGSCDEMVLLHEARCNFSLPRLENVIRSPGKCFAKFGKKKWIKLAFNDGKLQVATGSSYNDASLNKAQRDDELHRWVRTPDSFVPMRLHFMNKNGENEIVDISEENSGEMFQGKYVSDFYVWCCGISFTERMFSDFEADAVLIIRDTQKFEDRLAAAMSRLRPDWSFYGKNVSYIDDYLRDPSNIVPIFEKNFRFLYQNEFRYVWRKPQSAVDFPSHALPEALYPELGSLTDICEYHELVAG